jgi:hypothetical protein
MGLDHDFELVEQFLVVSFPPSFSLINVLFFHWMNSQRHSSALHYLLFKYFNDVYVGSHECWQLWYHVGIRFYYDVECEKQNNNEGERLKCSI